MKILALTENYPPDMSGGSVYAWEIPRRMARLGIKTLIVTRKASVKHADKTVTNVKIVRLDVPFYKTAGGSISKNRLQFALTLVKFALAHHKDYDVIHLYSGQATQIAGWILKKVFKIKTPIVLTYMGTFIGYWRQLKPFPIHNIYDAASKFLIIGSNLDMYFAVDDGTGARKVLLENGVPISKIKSHYQGVDIDFFKQKKIKKNRPIIGYIGRLDPFKGVDIFIQALPQVFERIPDLKVIIGGEGPTMEKLESLVNELGMKGKVSFIGNIPHEKTVNFFNTFDCLVITDIRGFENRNTLNLAICEAMSSGALIISSFAPRKEWRSKTWLTLKKPDTGELSQKIIDVLINPLEYQYLRKNSRKTAMKYFDWENIIRLYVSEFSRLISNSR